MDASIRVDALRAQLDVDAPALAGLLPTPGPGRKESTCDWQEVVERGFRSPGILTVSRATAEATTRDSSATVLSDSRLWVLYFSKASAADLVDLVDATLNFLQDRLPLPTIGV